MKPIVFCYLILLGLMIKANGQTAKDYAVPLQVIISSNPVGIMLKWSLDTAAVEYTIYRKSTTTRNWDTTIATLSGTATSFTDNTVTTGKAYEYFVQRKYSDTTRLAHGYIYTAIKKTIDDNKGTILVLVEENLYHNLPTETEQLKLDLIKDGWYVKMQPVSASLQPKQVKNIIATVAGNTEVPAITTIYVLGHLAIPYSGGFKAEEGEVYPPDGHEDHGGAWPTDLYYAIPDNNIWTDNMVNDTTPVRSQNKNIPGDAKFDLMYLGNHSLQYAIGRVDLTNMPAFSNDDIQLTRQYLNKAHAYKMAQTPVYRGGLIDDNFGAANGEAFASSAWNDFSTFFGDSIFEEDYTEGIKHKPYLFTYGCGFGNYTTCFGVTNSTQFLNDSASQIFTMLFGSYFGDWDNPNNLLRAPLASKNGGLASVWSGRPYWRFHHMALGKTIGYSTHLSQNNYFESNPVPRGYAHNAYPTFISMNLMGDPSLRLFMRKPMGDITTVSSTDSLTITVSWQPVPDAVGYYVSKTNHLDNGFSAHIELDTNTTSWTDMHPYHGYSKYMVRPIYLEQTPSGSYYNLGLGDIDSAYSINTVGLQKHNPNPSVKLFPNPASTEITITNELNTTTHIEVLDIYGRLLIRQQLFSGSGVVNISLLPSGYYFVRLLGNHQPFTQKLIKQ